jgi:hypothetical protein
MHLGIFKDVSKVKMLSHNPQSQQKEVHIGLCNQKISITFCEISNYWTSSSPIKLQLPLLLLDEQYLSLFASLQIPLKYSIKNLFSERKALPKEKLKQTEVIFYIE